MLWCGIDAKQPTYRILQQVTRVRGSIKTGLRKGVDVNLLGTSEMEVLSYASALYHSHRPTKLASSHSQQREVGSESQYWMSKLIGFDFEIQFKPGCTNCVDALSCKTVGSVELGALISTHGVVWTDLEKEIERDPLLSKIKQPSALFLGGQQTLVQRELCDSRFFSLCFDFAAGIP